MDLLPDLFQFLDGLTMRKGTGPHGNSDEKHPRKSFCAIIGTIGLGLAAAGVFGLFLSDSIQGPLSSPTELCSMVGVGAVIFAIAFLLWPRNSNTGA